MWTSEIGGKVSDDLSGERYTVTCGCGYSDADGRCGAPHRDTARCNDFVDVEADRQADAANESDLDALYERMTTEPACAKHLTDAGDCADGCECLDWTDLPTFGPEPKRISEGTWSWSPTRLIVGACADDLSLINRTEVA